ncbi:MAG: hypothetical protein FJX71_06670 [Alphaproteobacteria bacterium]|nr:hypothetical protein [Alphaproteobacteria bacterium]
MSRQLCNVVALYDLEAEKCNLPGWFDFMVNWFESIGETPQAMGLPTSQKLIRFESGKRKLEKNGFQGIEDIHLMGGVSEAGTNLNWKTSVEICLRKKGFLYICFDDVIQLLNKDYITKLVKDLSRFCNFKYGIAYQREFTKGPDWYVNGIIEGISRTPENNIEREKIACWFKKYSVNNHYKTGLLRDIYLYNILTRTHLDQRVKGQTLEQWILQNATHGDLQSVTDRHWLWSLKPTQIPIVQEILQEADLLLCYKL